MMMMNEGEAAMCEAHNNSKQALRKNIKRKRKKDKFVKC